MFHQGSITMAEYQLSEVDSHLAFDENDVGSYITAFRWKKIMKYWLIGVQFTGEFCYKHQNFFG